MARKLRIEYPGAIYHIINRGDRRDAIFHDDSDRELFLSTLAEAGRKTEWQVHAYSLMRNHFHPDPNITFAKNSNYSLRDDSSIRQSIDPLKDRV